MDPRGSLNRGLFDRSQVFSLSAFATLQCIIIFILILKGIHCSRRAACLYESPFCLDDTSLPSARSQISARLSPPNRSKIVRSTRLSHRLKATSEVRPTELRNKLLGRAKGHTTRNQLVLQLTQYPTEFKRIGCLHTLLNSFERFLISSGLSKCEF